MTSPDVPPHGTVAAFRSVDVPVRGGTLRAVFSVALVGDDPAGYPGLVSRWLIGSERDRYGRFAVDSARRNFLAGRMAAKTALGALDDRFSLLRGEILNGVWQQPCARGLPAGASVTLAHAGGIGVAVAHDDRWLCGIDIESHDRNAIATIATQVSDAEREWANQAGSDSERESRWLTLWSGREAFGKLLRTGIALPRALPALENLVPTPVGWSADFRDAESFRAHVAATASHVAACVFPAGVGSDAAIADAMAWIHSAIGGNERR